MLVKLGVLLLAGFGRSARAKKLASIPPAAPEPSVNPDLDVERPDEAFEVLRRVAEAADGDKRSVVLKKGRVPPHQRHLQPRVDLEAVARLREFD